MNKKMYISLFFFLTCLEAFGAAIWLISMPAESGHAIAFGYSAQRLLMIGGMAILGLASLVVLFLQRRKSIFSKRIDTFFQKRWLVQAALILALITWVLVFLPDYQWGRFGGYKSRLLPVILCFLLVAIQTCLIGIRLQKRNITASIKSVLSTQPVLLKSWTVFWGVMTGMILVIAIFRIGLIPDIVYWNDINVPLLGIQIFGVVIGSILIIKALSGFGFFLDGNRKGFQRILPDLVIFLLIWALAVVLWTQTDGPHSYFAPGPYPPNGERYPFSDAAGYDMAAHLSTIGGGLGTKTYVDKPLYVAFLSVIYLLVGSRMTTAVGLQVAVIACMPAVIYLLGRKLHNRLAGLISAGLIIFREINNINGTLWVLSANTKVFMTEALVTFLLVLFVFFFTAWVSDPEKKLALMASGGSLGLAGLVRLNPFFLFPVALAAIFFLFWKKWKRMFLYSGLFAAFFAAAVLPWMFQSYAVHDNFIFFTSTVRWVVLPQRTFYALNKPVETPTSLATPVIQPTKQTSLTPPTPAADQATQPVNKTWNKITGVSRYVSAHFMHNLIDTAAIFPTRLEFESLEKTIKSPGGFWSAEWNGNLPAGQIGLLVVNVAVIALGLASGWSRRRWAGLVPAGFLLVYSLATAAARTSSGRYFLPADWVGIVYFSLGIAQLVAWISLWWSGKNFETEAPQYAEASNPRFPVVKAALLLALFVLIGSAPVLLDRLIPVRYQPLDKTTVAAVLEGKGLTDSLSINKADLVKFLQSSDAVVYNGLGLYPRYYEMNKGEPDQFSEARGLPYPRLVLTVIGSDFRTSGILPLIHSPASLPNGSDVIAMGCKGELNDDWFALVVEGPQKQVILRSPAADWVCPAKPPVCDDNRECR